MACKQAPAPIASLSEAFALVRSHFFPSSPGYVVSVSGFCHQLWRDEPPIKLDQIHVHYCDNNEAQIVGKPQAMNRRLFLVIIAILLVVTVYMVSRNFDKIPDKRTTAPGKYIKELQGNRAGVKGRNSFLFNPRRKTHRSTLGMKCFSFTNAFQQHN